MYKYIFLPLLISSTITLLAQAKQDYVWPLGDDVDFIEPGSQGFRLDFNDQILSLDVSYNGYSFDRQIAAISDVNGNLLFYSNGCAILNKEAEVMQNGDSLNYDQFVELSNWDNCAELGYPGFQDILILEDYYSENGYYVIHKAVEIVGSSFNVAFKLRHSYVDLSMNDNLGAVTLKNQPLLDEYTVMGYLTAIQHSNKKDWWLIQPITNDSMFSVFLIGENGIERKSNQNSSLFFNDEKTSFSGTAKFSSDGTKYALYNYYQQLHLYDFDRATGQLSNHQGIDVYPELDTTYVRFSSVEWSPNSKFIYTASTYELHQIEINDEGQVQDILLIDEYNGIQDPFPTDFFLLNQGPDCKIYLTPFTSSNSYHVIKEPDLKGPNCDFIQNGVDLPITNSSGGFPNFPRYRVDEIEKCDPTITNIINTEIEQNEVITAYPVPSAGEINFTIQKANSKTSILISNSQGVLVSTIENIISGENLIDLSHLPNGIYYAKTINPDFELKNPVVKIILIK